MCPCCVPGSVQRSWDSVTVLTREVASGSLFRSADRDTEVSVSRVSGLGLRLVLCNCKPGLVALGSGASGMHRFLLRSGLTGRRGCALSPRLSRGDWQCSPRGRCGVNAYGLGDWDHELYTGFIGGGRLQELGTGAKGSGDLETPGSVEERGLRGGWEGPDFLST